MKRNFLLLVGLTALAFLAISLLASKDESPGNIKGPLFLPDIASQINAVQRVDIIAAGNVTVATLTRADQQWQLQQLDNYRADWPELQALLAGLATARVIEAKTDKPEYYTRLGVEDVAAKTAAGVEVKLTIGKQQWDIIIGHRAQGGKGQYVRLQGQAASALVDQQLDAPTETLQWADKRIIDINAADVAEVEIIHPGGGRILVTKASADDTDFTWSDIPKGRELKSSWAVNSLGSVLSLLDLTSVRDQSSVDWSHAVRMRLLMFSGLEIMAEMQEADGLYLIKLHAGHPAASLITKPGIADEMDDSKKSADKKLADKAAEDVAAQVAEINQRVTGWAYGIAKSKFEAMVKKPEDLLKPLKSS